jgi:hypothetical protein
MLINDIDSLREGLIHRGANEFASLFESLK